MFPWFVVIHRVDDATPIFCTANDIINSFNATQGKVTGLWPSLDYSGPVAPHSVGTPDIVAGVGYWKDRIGATPMKIAYRHRFVGDQIYMGFAIPE
jgi:hypothetical protein